MSNHKALLGSLVLLVTAGVAQAAPGYIDGPPVSNESVCGVNIVVKALRSWVGYYTDPATGAPFTGDVEYVHAVAHNVASCLNDEAGFYFKLPAGTSFAISAQNPVVCIRGNAKGEGPLPTDEEGAECLQKPTLFLNEHEEEVWYFGKATLPGTWYFEIRVPVFYEKRLDSSSADRELSVITSSLYGNRTARMPLAVSYRPHFANHASAPDTTGGGATVQFDLYHFFDKGVVDVQHGTDPNNMWQGSTTTATDETWIGAGHTVTLSGLTPGATNYWRVRITTAGGTWVGPIQSFVTPMATFTKPWKTHCRPSGC